MSAGQSMAALVAACDAAPRARRMRLPPLAAADIAAALATVPHGKRTAFIAALARELGVTVSWVYLRARPFRRRQRYFDIANLAATLWSAPHGARTALVDELARARGVNRSTVYRWLVPFRLSRAGNARVHARFAAKVAHAAAHAAAALTERARPASGAADRPDPTPGVTEVL